MIRFSFIVFVVALLFASCDKGLEDANVNPNETETAQPDYLLSSAIKSSADTYWGTSNNIGTTLLFIQHIASIQYTDADRYIFTSSSFAEPWKFFYSKSLADLTQIIQLAEANNNPNYKAVALTLRSWVFALLTEAYGDIPYSQALNIDAYITPAYDKQQDVYHGILTDLGEAVALFDPASKAIAGDLLYSGDITKWKKFANSLRLRYALRVADREPDFAKSTIAQLPLTDLIGNADIAQLTYQASPNQNPIALYFETRDDYRVSKTLVDKLKSLNDPRLAIYANKPTDASVTDYVGVPNGLLTSDANSLGLARTSKPGSYLTKAETPAVILSAAEVLFYRAEAAARGFTNESAEALYNEAIRASFTQFGITDAAILSAYLGNADVQYDATNFRKSIGQQKWIALYGQGVEAFTEWRRLDYPQLAPAVAGKLDGQMPLRFIYPGTEQSLNGKNYKAAVASQGDDVLTTRLWFDVN
jgi:hypothetical protein